MSYREFFLKKADEIYNYIVDNDFLMANLKIDELKKEITLYLEKIRNVKNNGMNKIEEEDL